MSKITYTNKIALNENADIPNVNKVTDSDINEIKTVVNNNDDELITTNTNLTNATTYSTTETVVGTWGGKPLYRKMYTGNLSQETIAHGLTNFKMASIYGNFYNPSSGNYFPLPSVRPSYPEYTVGVYVRTSNIVLERGASAQSSAMTFELILEYTKTTD